MSAAETPRELALRRAVVDEIDCAIREAKTTSDHCARQLADIVISREPPKAELETAKVQYAISAARLEFAERIKGRVVDAIVKAHRNGGAS